MSKHTPAPWRLVDDAQGPCMVMHPTKTGVAIASLTNAHLPADGFVEIEGEGAPERTANARLIAAAPDLLDACKTVLAYLDSLESKTTSDPTIAAIRQQYHKPLRDKLEPAIAKADGHRKGDE